MSVLGILLVILLLAFLVESLTEYLFGELANHIPAVAPYKWLTMYIAAAVGVLGAFVYRFDLLYLLSKYLAELEGNVSSIQVTTLGIVLTGLSIGRGANYIHDIISKFFTKGVTATLPPTSTFS